ncbi:hypothetical protein WG66_011682 [Moniliophthora roreri]|nr:hypothetical protein WG66_011682 [Moniliophthora roreri]
MPNSAVALQMFSTVGCCLLPPFTFLPLSCGVVFYGCVLSLESSESVFQLVEPPEAPFLMFFPSCGRLVGTVTWAGNKEVTVLIGSYYLA